MPEGRMRGSHLATPRYPRHGVTIVRVTNEELRLQADVVVERTCWAVDQVVRARENGVSLPPELLFCLKGKAWITGHFLPGNLSLLSAQGKLDAAAMNDMARSASAVIVSEGFTPGLAEIAAPSIT